MKFDTLNFATFEDAVAFFKLAVDRTDEKPSQYEMAYVNIVIESSRNDGFSEDSVVIIGKNEDFWLIRFGYMGERDDDMYDFAVDQYSDAPLTEEAATVLFNCAVAGFVPVELLEEIAHIREHPVISSRYKAVLEKFNQVLDKTRTMVKLLVI